METTESFLDRVVGSNHAKLTFGERNARIAKAAKKIGYNYQNMGPDGHCLDNGSRFILCPAIGDVIRTLIELGA